MHGCSGSLVTSAPGFGGRSQRRGRVHQGRPPLLGQPRQEVPDVGARDADRRVVHSQLGGGRERVFSLLKLMFGDTQMSALADDPDGTDAQVQPAQGGLRAEKEVTRKVSSEQREAMAGLSDRRAPTLLAAHTLGHL